MATNKRMTAKDYRKELSDLQKQQNVLEARIRNRASELCEKYPDVFSGCNGSNILYLFLSIYLPYLLC